MSILPKAHDFVLNVNGNFVQASGNNLTYKIGSGLRALRKASYLEATHDSSAHPTKCFPGTREQHIKDITGWATALAIERYFRLMWLHGPAGAGKSSLAQTCAEMVGSKLAATLFFSRTRKWDDPNFFFTSIAYQLTVKYASYRTKLDKIIAEDPALLRKTMAVQFSRLIVAPLRELQEEGKAIGEGVIFIDGLDECARRGAQCTIIDIVAASIRDRTTPFIWAFFSRPEPLIVAKFSDPRVLHICWQLTLPVSREANREIELYLRDGFQRVRTQHNTPSTVEWPPEASIQELVHRSAGLYAYAASVLRYISEGGLLGPEEQLLSLLELSAKSPRNPWSHLDAFYTLIMKQIPEDILPNTLKLLSGRTISSGCPLTAAAILRFPISTLYASMSRLHSVIKVTRSSGGLPESITFYHASFADFLENPWRSKEFCIKTPSLCASILVHVISARNAINDIVPWWMMTQDQGREIIKEEIFTIFWRFGSIAKLEGELLQYLSDFDYQQTLGYQGISISDATRFFSNIPLAWRGKIMQPCYSPLWRLLLQVDGLEVFAFTLGNGKRGDKPVLCIASGLHCSVVSYRAFACMRRQLFFYELRRQRPGVYFYLAFFLYWVIASIMLCFLFFFRPGRTW